MNTPTHIAIIMDGNGRWAKKHARPRSYGHIQGARVAKKIITTAANLKLRHLTLFAFSTENWSRPLTEVNFLMQLLARQIKKERLLLMENNIRFSTIGDLSALPRHVKEVVDQTVEMTAMNTGMLLTFALSYGGRQEIAGAARAIASKVLIGEISPDEVTEAVFNSFIPSRALPDPDLIIRTSGESRLSNFFLWQAAYSEIHISEKFWPEFTAADFNQALLDFSRRDRRFGKVHTAPEEDVSATV